MATSDGNYSRCRTVDVERSAC